MKAIHRMLFREIGQMKGQLITIALVVSAGIASLTASISVYRSLEASRARFYAYRNFADIFADFEAAPHRIGKIVRDIPGVTEAEPRLSFLVRLDLPDVPELGLGQFLSVPDGEMPRLNRLHLRSGRMPEAWRSDEVLVSEIFARANQLRPGDEITAVLNDKIQRLRVTGIAVSPEFIHTLIAGTPLPDDKRFGVFWMNESALANAFDLKEAFNSITLKIGPNASREKIIEQLDQVLDRYGSLGAYGREDQGSHRMVSDEIRQNRVTATIMPVIFLSVAAYLVHMVIRRLVYLQRPQIAALKAMGYEDRTVGLHYVRMVAILVVFGTLPGLGIGYWAGRWLTGVYQRFFMFPSLDFIFPPGTAALGIGASLVAGFAGVSLAVRSAVKLRPAEAMRPASPQNFRRFGIERALGVRNASPEARIALRNFLIRPFRSVLTGLAIGFAVAVVVLGVFWRDTIDYLLFAQFERAQPADAILNFRDPVSRRAIYEVAHFPAVLSAEEMRSVPVRLRAGHLSYRTQLTGLTGTPELKRLMTEDLSKLGAPPGGILLGTSLARKLQVQPGQSLRVEVLEGSRPAVELRVFGLINEMIGINAYVGIEDLNRLMGEQARVTGAAVLLDDQRSDRFFRHLREVPGVLATTARSTLIRSFRETSGSFILAYALILTAFGIIIAIGVVYNSARIALSERAWELASLRVLGFTRPEVFRILVGVSWLELLCGIPIGLGLAYWLARLVLSLIHTETFSLPLVIEPRSYATGAAVVLLSAAATGVILFAMIKRLDLIGVLKARE